MLKPIETMYNGYRFRSRLEARWAVFFDKMNVKYLYEIEGFILGGTRYLPDFYLPEQKLWIDVKPKKPSDEETKKARNLKVCVDNSVQVGVLYGEPWVIPDPDFSFAITDTYYCLFLIDFDRFHEDINCIFSVCRRCGRFLFSETIASHCECSQYADGHRMYGCCDRMGLSYTDELKKAYHAARQARFEHGETGCFIQ